MSVTQQGRRDNASAEMDTKTDTKQGGGDTVSAEKDGETDTTRGRRDSAQKELTQVETEVRTQFEYKEK